jgi:hypothetical protein
MGLVYLLVTVRYYGAIKNVTFSVDFSCHFNVFMICFWYSASGSFCLLDMMEELFLLLDLLEI